jgi:hypothetical protein
MTVTGVDQSSKFLRRLPVRYCVDCLSQLYGEPVETIRRSLGETGITCRQAHCGNCGEHKDIFMALFPPGSMGYRTSRDTLMHSRTGLPNTKMFVFEVRMVLGIFLAVIIGFIGLWFVTKVVTIPLR